MTPRKSANNGTSGVVAVTGGYRQKHKMCVTQIFLLHQAYQRPQLMILITLSRIINCKISQSLDLMELKLKRNLK